jgi:hypothetical protein
VNYDGRPNKTADLSPGLCRVCPNRVYRANNKLNAGIHADYYATHISRSATVYAAEPNQQYQNAKQSRQMCPAPSQCLQVRFQITVTHLARQLHGTTLIYLQSVSWFVYRTSGSRSIRSAPL